MDAKKFLEEARRMCKAQGLCKGCPIGCGERACLSDSTPGGWALENIERIVTIVERWSQEHPRKTRLQDFREKYPNAPLNGNGIPNLIPQSVGYCGNMTCYACDKAKDKPLAWCWEQEVEEE